MEDKSLAINNMPRTQANVLKRGAAYAELVVRTAKIKCNCGDGHDVINLPLDHAVYSGTTPLVTIKDMVVDTNICNGFGVCSTPDGQKLECKKEIIVTHEWVNKQELRTRINGVEALSTDAWTICGKHGGVITIENSGQSAKYGPNANAETNVNNMEENADTSLGEGTGVKTPTLEECDIAIAMLGKLWFAAGPAEREKLHREANLLREYKGYIGKSVPLSDEFKASVEACFGGGSDPLKTGITSLDTKVMSIDEIEIIRSKDDSSLSVYSVNIDELTSLQRKMLIKAMDEYSKTSNPDRQEFWLDSITEIIDPSTNPAFENYLYYHHRISEPIQGTLQVIGGLAEMKLGLDIYVATSATIVGIPVGKVVAGYVMADGASNFTGGFSRGINAFNGSNDRDSWNFMKNAYKKVSPEYGEFIYGITQIGIGIYSIRTGLREIPSKNIKFHPRKSHILKAQNQGLATETLVINIENKVVITEQTSTGMILNRVVINKKDLEIGTLLIGLDVVNSQSAIESISEN